MQVISVTFPKKIVVTVAVTAKHVTSADLAEILLDLDAINGEVIGTTAAEKTDKIEATKLAIETAIETAGVDVPAGTVFADYPAKIATIGDNYVRPSFWPELPEIAVDENGNTTEEVIYMLVAVYPGKAQFRFYQIQENTTINWGDGTSANYNTDAFNITKEFNFDNILSDVNERGYKVVTVEIRPQANNHITYIYGTSLLYSNNIIDFKASIPYGGNDGVFSFIRDELMLESIEFVGKYKRQAYVALGNGIGSNCPRLSRFVINLSESTNCTSVFAAARIIPTNVDISAATEAGYLFFTAGVGNMLLINVKMPISSCGASHFVAHSPIKGVICDDCSNITDFTNAFINAVNLQILRVPNTKVSLVASGTLLDYDALKLIIEHDLFPGVTDKIFTITGSYGATEISAAITAGTIIVPAGWTVIN